MFRVFLLLALVAAASGFIVYVAPSLTKHVKARAILKAVSVIGLTAVLFVSLITFLGGIS